MSTTAKVNLWGRTILAVSLEDEAATATFEYNRAFINSGIEVAPLTMPLSSRLYSFPVAATGKLPRPAGAFGGFIQMKLWKF